MAAPPLLADVFEQGESSYAAARPSRLRRGRSYTAPIEMAAMSLGTGPAVKLCELRPSQEQISRSRTSVDLNMTPAMRMKNSRLVDRHAPFRQSFGRLNIRRVDDTGSVSSLRREDWFHSLVNLGTRKLVLLVIGVVVASWLACAVAFWIVSPYCGLKANTFLKALYLAIETVETIGYGVPNSYFDGCRAGILVLGSAALWSSVLNAMMISVIYTRISRATVRANSVCFTDKAIIAKIGDSFYLLFQAVDFRKHQLCEAHVRLYCIQHAETDAGVSFQSRAMRLQHPDDELGGTLLLALPQMIVHRIDAWSPLCPATAQRHAGGTPANSFQFPEIPQRAADGENGNRDSQLPPGENPLSGLTASDIGQHIVDNELEILVLVEGIEPLTSSTLQARHSYCADDIVFNACFQRCVFKEADGACRVNLTAFHELVPMNHGHEMSVQSMS
eukprot:TRINITY_DN27598_c0_g1_i4.p1 TRINITY_DN27598_c0_g1~~TRINITY_DN27598_c0_g1_i4.p1  ORF type:complete len:446 (-),score=52.46 TRINITY_DN27598_c0_g1_i4:195-1532(-)